MQITIKLFATLRNQRFKVEVQEYPEGSSVKDVASALDIQEEDLAIILVNGRDADLDTILVNDAVLCFFPPVGGG
ncbi:molybdopterin synthase sulfur carrier subunit [Desulfuribacillus stibiiarsenatis]|uniref:Molybdopterin synthase sulfur carrier subunit n=1 Tax=Desulfuribacillus stibiiarsenatis TaxID=1390249 RepID=A0A1E5L846_9FIRM|nr:MoaD/ThiS family protein [Desulfuribacillus stibiiarsenatis]OEH86113.1 molybdopterin synthase sulfur carrier subunit [Desulfuribacillus stibiiarsenatis]